ncbi:citrate lyase acyl carrier protein citd [Lucifera butyrica]|uniref:Citrate lyase acyl carrier protein citd n=1 Tax=Lucifera butyrica TaxID=1351585 RepID=A0A498R6I7_9FIRM|nr:citrate lyase acyl carrier protein [Lucifera butyrica]VBB06520.1 citrate lyase acyl carrier protein citd [Lucifera butyrica]
MANNVRTAQAGTLESNDIMLTVAPGPAGSGIQLDLDSIVLAQYGPAIRQTILTVLAESDVTDVYIKAVDRGALDCTIRARTLAVLGRAGFLLKGELV